MARSAAAVAHRPTRAPRGRRAGAQALAATHVRLRAARLAAPGGCDAPFARAARGRAGGLLDALLSGRGWIALVFLLLAGIVFFNVDLLQMNRDIARNAEQISALKRENARLRPTRARLGQQRAHPGGGRRARARASGAGRGALPEGAPGARRPAGRQERSPSRRRRLTPAPAADADTGARAHDPERRRRP